MMHHSVQDENVEQLSCSHTKVKLSAFEISEPIVQVEYLKRLLVTTSTNQNADKQKRRQTETSTNQNVDKPKRRQTKTSTNQNADKPKHRQTKKVDKPKTYLIPYLIS